MKVQLYDSCKLYAFDRDSKEFFIIEPEKVGAEFINGQVRYFLLSKDRNLLIVQAMNEKKASAKILTLISIDNAKNRSNNNPRPH